MKPERRAALFFLPEHEIDSIVSYGAGHVNDTYLVTLHTGEQRILQRLNPSVFPEPLQIIHNLRLVCEHLRGRSGQDHNGRYYQLLTLFRGRDSDAYQQQDGAVWRMVNLIGQSRTFETIETPGQAEELGRGLGSFHLMLSTLDASLLHDTLPGFHYTPGYLDRYDQLPSCGVSNDPRVSFCRRFIPLHRPMAGRLENCRDQLSHGIIHGDPKVNNFLFNRQGTRVISLIDLDTVRSGLLLHDLGDGLRSCCNTAGEAPAAPAETVFDAALFTGWLQGYFARAGSMLSEADRQYIVDAAALLAFELGLRFFSDYLQGNRYFKVRFTEQNLLRAATQFHLVSSIERQQDNLNSIVRRIAADYPHIAGTA